VSPPLRKKAREGCWVHTLILGLGSERKSGSLGKRSCAREARIVRQGAARGDEGLRGQQGNVDKREGASQDNAHPWWGPRRLCFESIRSLGQREGRMSGRKHAGGSAGGWQVQHLATKEGALVVHLHLPGRSWGGGVAHLPRRPKGPANRARCRCSPCQGCRCPGRWWRAPSAFQSLPFCVL